MSLQIRRGPNSGAGGRTGVTLVPGEIAFVTDYASANVSPMWIGDGNTLGGIPVAPVLNVNGLTGAVNLTTTQIGEGSGGSNLYFTTTRAIDAVGTNLAGGILSGLTISYNSTTHTISITNTNVIQTGTSKSVAYYNSNGTTLSPTNSMTWDESANILQLTASTLYVTANNGLRPTVVYDNYNSTGPNSLAFRKGRGTNITPTIVPAAEQIHQIVWQGFDGTTFANTSSIIGSVMPNTTPAAGNVQGTLQFYTTDSGSTSATLYPRVRLDNTGLMVVGPYATSESGSGQVIVRQQISSNGKTPLSVYNMYNDAYPSSISIIKARGSFAAPVAVTINDALGAINFRGYYGSGYATAANIIVNADLSPGAGFIPGTMSFQVTNASGILTEALKITNDGNTSATGNFTINGSLTVNGTTVTSNTTTINVEDKLMKLGYLTNGAVSDTGAVSSITGSLLQASTTFTISGTSIAGAATYTAVSQTATSGTGSGAVFTIQKTGAVTSYFGYTSFASGTVGTIKGSLSSSSISSTSSGTSVTAASTYTAVSQSATSGSGTGAVFTIQKIGVGTAYNGAIVVNVTTAGTGYAIGDTITIPGASLGGATPANNLTLTVATTLVSPWTATVSGLSGVSGLVIGATINATAGSGALYSGSPSSCIISTVGSTSITYTVTGGTTPVAGSITTLVQPSNLSITITTGGTNYAIGDTVTIPGASLGGATPTNNLILTVATALGGPWTANITGLSDTVDLQVGSAITATGAGTTGTITATATTHAVASCTSGSASGTVLTIGGTVSGVFTIGMMLSGAGINSGIYIISGSGTTWNLSTPTIIGSTAITGTSNLVTVNSTSSLQNNTIITSPSVFGGLAANTSYYVNFIVSATQFSVGANATTTNDVTLTTATGSVVLTYLNGSLGSGGTYLISNITSATSVTYVATGGTTPVAGPITAVATNGSTDFTANGGGIQVYGASNKTLTWSSTTSAWTSSEHINLASSKAYEINGVSVLNSTTLGANVVSSSLTSVGTLTALSVNGTTLIGPSASSNTTRFPSAQAVISNTASGIQQNETTTNIGLIAEAVGVNTGNYGVGLYGVGYTAGNARGTGVTGEGHVSATGDTASAVGVRGYSLDTHAGGLNVALYADASGSSTGNYALYMNSGNIYSGGAVTWTLSGNLSFSGAYTVGFTAATATSTSTAASVGYQGMPQNTQSSAYPIVIGDAGKHIYASATMTATIPANGAVAFPIGTTIAFIAGAGATLTIAITTDKLYLGGAGTGGAGVSRTLAAYGMATAVKVASDTWFINGTGLT